MRNKKGGLPHAIEPYNAGITIEPAYVDTYSGSASIIIPVLIIITERRGMVFIETGGVLTGSARYFLIQKGLMRLIAGVSKLLRTQLANM